MSESSRQIVPLYADDLSRFAKSLAQQLGEHQERRAALPGHVELLNMLARAAGHRNLQGLRARALRPTSTPATAPEAPQPPASTVNIDRALRHFDAQARLVHWPVKRSTQLLMLWGLWMRFDAKRPYRESEVNQILNAWHGFGDHCTLRRELVVANLLERKPDGSEYRKCAARPDNDARHLMAQLRQRERDH
jgi:hypothetical protein